MAILLDLSDFLNTETLFCSHRKQNCCLPCYNLNLLQFFGLVGDAILETVENLQSETRVEKQVTGDRTLEVFYP